MLRKLGIVGLAVPLIAIVGALVYLSLFGTEEPTFDAATRDLAGDYTVVRLRVEPPAAMVAPSEPTGAVVAVVVLSDDERHVWAALRSLGLLAFVEPERIVLIPAVSGADTEVAGGLWELVDLASQHAQIEGAFIAAFDGKPLTDVCRGEGPRGDWSGVAMALNEQGEGVGSAEGCGGLPIWRGVVGQKASDSMVQWMHDVK